MRFSTKKTFSRVLKLILLWNIAKQKKKQVEKYHICLSLLNIKYLIYMYISESNVLLYAVAFVSAAPACSPLALVWKTFKLNLSYATNTQLEKLKRELLSNAKAERSR